MSSDPNQQTQDNDEPPQNQQAHSENTNQTDVELQVKNSDEPTPQNTDENKVIDIDKQNDNIQETLEKETNKQHHIARPSIVALVNKKVTWKQCLSPYHLARLGISGGIAMLAILSIVGIAYALNPNPCTVGQPVDADKFDPDSISNMAIFCWRLSLFFMPIIKLFGHEWLWTPKKIKVTIILGVIIIFVLFVPSGFFRENVVGFYVYFIVFIGVLFSVCYIFALSGFYVFWLVFPFGVAFILAIVVVGIADFIFNYGIRPDGDFFTISYTIFLLTLQCVAMKFHLYAIPYKCGKCFTCCCNKGKTRQARNKNPTVQDELSDMALFYYSMVIISVVETFRMAGYTALQDERGNFNGLYSYLFYNILTEVMSRNGVIWEILYKCLKKELPPRSRVDAIYYGAANQGEFIPIWMLLLLNIVNYGPYRECCRYRNLKLSPTVNMFGNWWLIGIFLLVQLMQIILSELMVRCARCMKWYGIKNEKGEDPPRKIILVDVNLKLMIWILIHCYICSLFAFFIDNNNRFRENNVVSGNDSGLIESTMFSTTMDYYMFDSFDSTMMSDENICT